MLLSRRGFLRSSTIIPFATWIREAPGAGTTYTRYEARSVKGKAMLQLYQTAVANMKDATKTPEGSPTSWLFQWYTHWVPGAMTPGPKAAAITKIYKTDQKYKALATTMWDTCQPHGGEDENFFLPWHRMFVYYLERIVRKASGNADFALPYWNYSVQGSAHGAIPPEFTKTASSLYVKARNPGVNTGQAIDRSRPGTLNLDVLKQTRYDSDGPVQGFCMAMDAGIHGNVHVLVGNGQNMGDVPYACGDPVFWMHHCNIDRLWASWNQNGGKNLGDSDFLKQQFVFADENANQVSVTIKDFLDIGPLNYQYDRLEPAPPAFRPLTPTELTTAAHVTAVPTGNASGLALTNKPVSVTLEPPASLPAPNFTARVANLGAKRLYVVIREPQTNTPPETLYGVYINMPENTPDNKRAAYYAGAINFFGAMPHDHTASKKFVSFDITDSAQKLQKAGALKEKATVTIIPLGAPAGDAKPVIGQLSLVER